MPRFFQSPPWHLLVTDRDSATITLLDRLATDRRAHYELGTASTFSASVPSDSPEVNILHDDNFGSSFPFLDDYPFLAEGVRFLYGLRKDGDLPPTLTDPYQCRFAGMILETDDDSNGESPRTRFTAYDPWAYLYARPCLLSDGNIPSNRVGHVRFEAGDTLDEIALELLRRSIVEHGDAHIDAGTAWGGTALFNGEITTCAALTEAWIVPDGTSVGEAWTALVDTGNIEIFLRPIYDLNRPGYLVEFNNYIQNVTGTTQPPWQPDISTSFFGSVPLVSVDRSGRGVTRFTRNVNGRERANKIQFFGGGPAAGVAVAVKSSTASVNRFGEWWAQEQLTREISIEKLEAIAGREIARRKSARRTWTFALVPEWEIVPFRDFDLGYGIIFYHSQNMREEMWEYALILGYTVDISDDGAEHVPELMISVDEQEIEGMGG